MPRFWFEQFCLDTDQRALVRGGQEVRLTPRAFRLLEFLVAQRPKAVSKRELLDHVWQGTVVEEANLKTLVLEIRTALEDRGAQSNVIRTVFGYGYAFAVRAEEETDAADAGAAVSVRWGGGSVLLPEGSHLIGRRADCAICVDDPSVSRVHARLEVTPDALRIEDLRSKNGTFAGGRRVEGTAELLPQAELRIGEVRVEVSRLGAGEASTLTVA
jgi:DNA-binding winged helix-turn-helix (wHTH) protein